MKGPRKRKGKDEEIIREGQPKKMANAHEAT